MGIPIDQKPLVGLPPIAPVSWVACPVLCHYSRYLALFPCHTTIPCKMSTKLVSVLTLALLPLTGGKSGVQKYQPGGWCCLCMCHAVDENKCARPCLRMQHGNKIIEEPEMKACTKSCLDHGVKQIFPEDDKTSDTGER